MANYLKSTDFAAKDALISGNPSKIIKGAEINDEFDAIQTAINSKANLDSPTLTGAPKAPTATLGTETTQIASTAFVANAINAITSDTGSLGLQSADNVNITGGSITGITDLAVADGGTGASTAAGARTNLSVPSTTGEGASGDWNINVTGSVSTSVVNAAIAGSAVNAVGTYSYLYMTANTTVAPGGTLAGSSLRFAGSRVYDSDPFNAGALSYAVYSVNSPTPAGTWRCMGAISQDSVYYSGATTVWLRIS